MKFAPLVLAQLNQIGLAGDQAHLVFSFLATLLCLLFAIVLYWTVEKPSQKLAHYVSTNLRFDSVWRRIRIGLGEQRPGSF